MIFEEGFQARGDAVPPEDIRGAWAVDDDGRLAGEYRANPRFRASRN